MSEMPAYLRLYVGEAPADPRDADPGHVVATIAVRHVVNDTLDRPRVTCHPDGHGLLLEVPPPSTD